MGAVVLGEYLCLQRELEAIPLSNDEREARERRTLQQAQTNAQNSHLLQLLGLAKRGLGSSLPGARFCSSARGCSCRSDR